MEREKRRKIRQNDDDFRWGLLYRPGHLQGFWRRADLPHHPRTAEMLGLGFPPSILATAGEVIE
jgi:hypothetical protein